MTLANPRMTLHPGAERRRSSACSARRGFTLVEIMVVIGIIAILAAVIIPVSVGVIKSNRNKQTLATMQVLENAIGRYVYERPMASDQAYTDTYGPYPPNGYDDQYVAGHFAGAVGIEQQVGGSWEMRTEPATEDYRSIEALYLYLHQLSPQARQILDGLPDKITSNQDTCNGSQCPDALAIDRNGDGTPEPENRIALVEVVDAFGQPLRYDVGLDDQGQQRWELRSAGEDELFSDPFTPVDLSDDVVLRGN